MSRTTIRALDVDGITTTNSPYPSATLTGETIYVSGQVSFADDGSVFGEGNIELQTRRSLERLSLVLSAYGATLADVVCSTVFLTDPGQATGFNRAWATAFDGHRPSRATVVAGLLDPRLLVEVQAIARLPREAVQTGPSK